MTRRTDAPAGPGGHGTRIAVIGTGYLGATHAAAMAEWGYEVLGVDVDPAKVEELRAGRVPFYEPGLGEVLARNVAAGRLRFTTSLEDAARWADVHFLCVGTPQQETSYAANLTYVDDAVAGLAPLVRAGALVVGKSTVPVGTAHRLAALLADRPDGGAELAWNPEFLREGHAVADTLHPDRLVFGVRPGGRAEEVLREVYAPAIGEGSPVVVTDFATAELVKVAANSFLATKISFVNAMAEICEAAGGDVTTLADAIGHDERIGRRFLNAGLGFGGGCLPKDIRAFMARAGQLGADQAVTFLREVDAINLRRRTHVVRLVHRLLGGRLVGKKVAVLGLAFKPESDDVRDSPALDVAGQLHLDGADVMAWDPQAVANARRVSPNLGYAGSLEECVAGADAVLLLTEWRVFRELDPLVLAGRVKGQVLVDARNVLDRDAWASAGWTVRGLGR